jgi:hypothetical protein
VGIRKHGSNLSRDEQALSLGTSRMLEQLLVSRPSLARHADLIDEAIVQMRLGALDCAFAQRDFQAVQEIEAMLPPGRKPAPVRVKRWVAALPAPVRSAVAAGLLAAGSARASQRRA